MPTKAPAPEITPPAVALQQPDLSPALLKSAESLEKFGEKVAGLGDGNAQLLAAMAKLLDQLHNQPTPVAPAAPQPPPRKWRLTVKRDPRGLLDSIDATQLD